MMLLRSALIIAITTLLISATAYYGGYTVGYFIGCKDAVRLDMEPATMGACFDHFLGASNHD